MKASLEIEYIGDNLDRIIRQVDGMLGVWDGPLYGPTVKRLLDYNGITGFGGQILYGKKDYSRANSKGSRGIYVYYLLDYGVYAVHERMSWKRTRDYFLWVDDAGEKVEVTKDEAIDHILHEKTIGHQRT